jgi:hypothetical protein
VLNNFPKIHKALISIMVMPFWSKKELDVKELALRAIKQLDPDVIEDTIQIKKMQKVWDRYDMFGLYETPDSIYEFAISITEKGKTYRLHKNLLSPKKIRKEFEDKLRRGKEGEQKK